jgi:hypothetical protein
MHNSGKGPFCENCGLPDVDEEGYTNRVDECTCESPPRNLCFECHHIFHPVKSAMKINWGEVDKFEGREQ